MGEWTFLTNHARVLMVIAQEPNARLRDIAATLDITERATQRIVSELVESGYVSRFREGRRNRYVVHSNLPMRISQARDTEVGEILDVLLADKTGGKR